MQRILVATDFSTRSDRALRRAALLSGQLNIPLTVVHVVDADQSDRLISASRDSASILLSDMTATFEREDGLNADWLVLVDDVYAGIEAAAEQVRADLVVIGPHRHRPRDIFVGTTAERFVHRSTHPLLIAVEPPTARHSRTLLALDFDQASRTAARKALEMGVFDHTEVIVMHGFDAPAEGMLRRAMVDPEEITDYVQSEAATASEDIRALTLDLGLPPTAQTIVAIKGTPARTIVESAQRVACDLVVLGTNQRKGFERALVGSVTAQVLKDAKHDVLIIPVDEPI